MTTTTRTFLDGHGVEVRIGDRVVINAWGDVRQCDIGTRGTVTGFARTRIIVAWDTEWNGPIGNVPAEFVGVLRSDGVSGFEGNVRR